VAYDAESLAAGRYPPQDAQTVFTTRKAVCAGYANLLAALGEVINEEIIVVTGDSRNQSGDISGGGHAWNAAKIEDNWYLIDATWDSGYVDASGFTKQYSTDYLLPPPETMAITHFPENPQWQLLATPLSRGEFLRQPMMRPSFFAEGMTLLVPTRSQTDVQQVATIQIDNPQERWMMATFGRKGEQASVECDVMRGATTSISCPLPNPGTYEVSLFSSGKQYGTYQFVGRIAFNKRG
jgi:transglutaminase/protease-like cytokinesis protein 3